MKHFSHETRSQNLNQLQEDEFDLLIIGGGISGAGVARDAASRGMKVALVECDDYASGTSSKSSKLIHGGIRYLEHLEFGLVFEALSERSLLFDMAPHLVHPLRFLLPLYKDSRVGPFKMGLGMFLYDALSLFDAPQMHERLNSEQTRERIPFINQQNLAASFEYSDAYMDDDRLVIETLRSANSWGACCVNFVSATGSQWSGDSITEVQCVDHLSKKEFSIKAKQVVSTVGPWTDEVAQKLTDHWKPKMRPSKGIHLTFHKSRLPLDRAVVLATGADNRIIFGIPRHEMVIVGTTDTDFKEDPRSVATTKDDVEYLLKIVNEYFPLARLTKKDILASYSGVRPLVDDGSKDEGSTSREHSLIKVKNNLTFLMGGKYTTYRAMAEEAVESTLDGFSTEDRVKFSKSHSKEAINPLVTGQKLARSLRYVDTVAFEINMDPEELRTLISRHGEEGYKILNNYPEYFHLGIWALEAAHAIDNTMCMNMVDFYLRRVPLFLCKRDHGYSELEAISQVFAEKLNWTSATMEKQVKKIKDYQASEMGWA